MVKTVEITGTLEDSPVRIVVQAATVLTGMKRSILINRARDELDGREIGDSVGDVATLLVSRFTYPDMLASTVEAEGLDMDGLSLADFLALPEELVDAWMVAVYDLCPHWAPGFVADEAAAEVEKKDKPFNAETLEFGS